MKAKSRKRNKKATFLGTFGVFGMAVFLFILSRWLFIEPFVIPSGSMIPTLLLNDHILVTKYSYGVRIPFVEKWLWRWSIPERGEIIVFIGVENSDQYLIKRVMGLPGEIIEIQDDGEVWINGKELPRMQKSISPEEKQNLVNTKGMSELYGEFRLFENIIGSHEFWTFQSPRLGGRGYRRFELGPNEIFAMGDNRDNSHDSRFFGPVNLDKVVGPAWTIWLSCDRGQHPTMGLCGLNELRSGRFLKTIN